MTLFGTFGMLVASCSKFMEFNMESFSSLEMLLICTASSAQNAVDLCSFCFKVDISNWAPR